MPVGLKQKRNVNIIVQKVCNRYDCFNNSIYIFDIHYMQNTELASVFQFLQENFTIILFHYDGNMDGWWDLKWSKKAVHIVADNQTKW